LGTIGIYDYDFMNYEQVIPNLECAKLSSYFKNKKQITVLAPEMAPERYTEFYIRKEYNDGLFPPEFFSSNVNYGGRAFSSGKYIPFDNKIERTIPDFSGYEKYFDRYGHTKHSDAIFKKILRSVHLRLAPDGENADEQMIKYCLNNYPQTSGGIILHDYHPANIKNLFDILYELSNCRKSFNNNPKPLPIGNKYPIDIYSSKELQKWIDIYPMSEVFFLRFRGLMDNEVLAEMLNKNRMFSRQIYYMIDEGCSSENDFLENRAIKIFKQLLFYRMSNTRILLKYTDGFFQTKELKFLIELWNCFGNAKWFDNFMSTTQTLYRYCSSRPHRLYRDILYRARYVNQYEMRETFQYIRIHNYELFKMFYEWDNVFLKGGEIHNAWK
jgi:hypothetical protein